MVNSALASLLVIALSLAHGPAISFLYDAAQYWNGPMALVNGGDAATAGALSMRGTLTPLVYLPPALVVSILGPGSAAWTVLMWNSLFSAAVCVFLLPRLAALVSMGPPLCRTWLSALIGGALFSGFAQHPLLDVWAVGAALTGLLALASGRHWWTAILGGVAFAISVNLRPSYAVPLVILAAVLVISQPRRVALMIPGVLLGLIPQFALNLALYGSVSVLPYGTGSLATTQAAQATYTIRYDTVLHLDRHPQQWYCDPEYAAQLVGDRAPTDQLGVVGSVLDHLPHSLWFLTEKAAASMQWSSVTPYAHAPTAGTSLTTLLVVGVASTGVVALVTRAILYCRDRTKFAVTLAILGFWLGSLATIVLSTPETRFAIPLVFVGLIGLLSALPVSLRAPRAMRLAVVGTSVSALVAIALFGAGKAALSSPVPAGRLKSVSACAGL